MALTHHTRTAAFSSRAERPNTPPLAQYLLSLISIKRSNLCVSADVSTTSELLKVAEEVGDHICLLKTHADIIDDWSRDTIMGLQEIAKRKHFLLFEDRKFGDIGSTLKAQYQRGTHQIATWAHVTNAHILPGPDIIKDLHSAAQHTLTTLNQSVDTFITAGAPQVSLDDEPGTSPTQTTTSSERPGTNTQPPQPSSGSEESPNAKKESQLLFSHSHNLAGTATATTTVSQHSESLSPRQPPSLKKSLSEGEEEKGPHNPQKLLSDLGPPPHARGLLILAEMSSEGALTTKEWVTKSVEAARAFQNLHFVLGFISQRSLNAEDEDNFISMAPGVKLPKEGEEGKIRGDGMGQQYRDPKQVVGRDGIDVVIVGRGVLEAEDMGKEAEKYRRAAWEAYEERIGRR